MGAKGEASERHTVARERIRARLHGVASIRAPREVCIQPTRSRLRSRAEVLAGGEEEGSEGITATHGDAVNDLQLVSGIRSVLRSTEATKGSDAEATAKAREA